MSVTKNDMVIQIAKKTGLEQQKVKQIVQLTLDGIIEILADPRLGHHSAERTGGDQQYRRAAVPDRQGAASCNDIVIGVSLSAIDVWVISRTFETSAVLARARRKAGRYQKPSSWRSPTTRTRYAGISRIRSSGSGWS